MSDEVRRVPSDGLVPSVTGRSRWPAVFLIIALGESLTLAVLLVNLLVLSRSSEISAAVGPIHGGFYLAGVLLTWTGRFSHGTKIIAVVPVVGAWVALRRAGGR